VAVALRALLVGIKTIRNSGDLFGDAGVREDDAGDLIWIECVVLAHEVAAHRSSYEDIWAFLIRLFQQFVQARRGADGILAAGFGFAPAIARAVVSADAGGLR